jgi:hypothetical protein
VIVTSRARLKGQIEDLESELRELGYGDAYFDAIRDRVANGRTDPRAMKAYEAALRKTITSKRAPQNTPALSV